MSHNFVKQADGSIVCSNCADEKGVDVERDCPRPMVAAVQPGNYFKSFEFIEPFHRIFPIFILFLLLMNLI
jgi:hypothetical protein